MAGWHRWEGEEEDRVDNPHMITTARSSIQWRRVGGGAVYRKDIMREGHDKIGW